MIDDFSHLACSVTWGTAMEVIPGAAPARVCDNPHKPGTVNHREWEQEHIHRPRTFCLGDWAARKAEADARLAALRQQVQRRPTGHTAAVEAILAEVADATRPEPKATEKTVFTPLAAAGYTITASGPVSISSFTITGGDLA